MDDEVQPKQKGGEAFLGVLKDEEEKKYIYFIMGIMGIGDWGLGIGHWGLGPIPNPQSPIPNPQSPLKIHQIFFMINYFFLNFLNK